MSERGGYVVKYRIAGFEGERTTEVYSSYDEAIRQADDIRGYEGVQYADVELAEKGDQDDEHRTRS